MATILPQKSRRLRGPFKGGRATLENRTQFIYDWDMDEQHWIGIISDPLYNRRVQATGPTTYQAFYHCMFKWIRLYPETAAKFNRIEQVAERASARKSVVDDEDEDAAFAPAQPRLSEAGATPEQRDRFFELVRSIKHTGSFGPGGRAEFVMLRKYFRGDMEDYKAMV